MARNAAVDAMILTHILALEEGLKKLPRVPAWRIPVREKRTRAQAKKRKARRKRTRKSRRGKRR